MNILSELQVRFRTALAGLVDDPAELVEMVRPSQDPKFGDYQANFAMPLGKRLGRPPREVAAEVVGRLDVADLCQPPEIAGPGFINLRLEDEWLVERLTAAVRRSAAGRRRRSTQPRTFVVDYSAPNVAKPMHVGHIRSTVIGDALCRMLRFLGHRVDQRQPHRRLGHPVRHDPLRLQALPATPRRIGATRSQELARLYRLVRQLMDYHEGKRQMPKLREQCGRSEVAASGGATATSATRRPPRNCAGRSDLEELATSRRLEASSPRSKRSALASWPQHIPTSAAPCWPRPPSCTPATPRTAGCGRSSCRPAWTRSSGSTGGSACTFDHTLGESFYEDRLAARGRGTARSAASPARATGRSASSSTATTTPMIVRKQDGAFLYATTDLATIRYRMETWQPDAILYVVDHRQSLHFEQLFAAARLLGYDDVELQHVSFGTVLGDDGRPFKTRSGDTVGLEGLLDEAVRRARRDRRGQRRRQARRAGAFAPSSGARSPRPWASPR